MAPLDPSQTAGQEALKSGATTAGGIAAEAKPAWQYQLGSYDVANNPVVADYAEAAIEPIFRQLRESALPAVRSHAIGSGNLGGSKPALAEAQSVERAVEAAGRTTAGIYSDAYGRGLDASGRAVAQTPQLQQQELLKGNVLQAIGEQNRGVAQAGLNEDVARHDFNQAAPYQQLMDYLTTIQSGFGGRSDTTVTGTPADNVSQIISLIMGGASSLPGIIEGIRGIFKPGVATPVPAGGNE